ncbi:Uncharacterised protein [Streptococcus pneumoniae]|nr:Uncharacterised protein [Streptococcus pneumoniae]
MVATPRRASRSAALGPTPHSRPTGSGWRKSRVRCGGTISRPSGLAAVDAVLATNFTAEPPTVHGSPSSERTRSRIRWPMCSGGPSRRRAPATSRNASSTLSCSITGVTSANTAITSAETAR